MLALINGHEATAEALIAPTASAGALEKTNGGGNTSLMIAIKNKHEAAAEALIAPTASAGALDVQVDG
jgi:ankyrin repeat protein